jgi:hypothetical protein
MGLFDAIGSLLGIGGGGGLIPSDITLRHKEIVPVTIAGVKKIDPIAAHIKEISHIDPLQVDGFNVTEVRNIDPLRVQQFNVTTLPHVNMSLRQLPPLDLNVRKVPPLSVGLHQNFRVPSNYTVRTHLLGIEVMRVSLQGESVILPQDKYHREQVHTPNLSCAQPAVGGNSAIPARHREVGKDKPAGKENVAEKFEKARLRYSQAVGRGNSRS